MKGAYFASIQLLVSTLPCREEYGQHSDIDKLHCANQIVVGYWWSATHTI